MKLGKLLLSLFIFVFSVTSFAQQKTAEDVLQSSLDKLNSLKTIKYKYFRELNYSSEKYLSKVEAETYIDFTESKNFPGARYLFTQPDYQAVFNGAQLFKLDKKGKTIDVKHKPTVSDLTSSSFYGNTPMTFKRLFPQLLKDTTIDKTLSETATDYVVEFSFTDRYFDKYGEIKKAELTNKQTHRITISKSDMLPRETLTLLNETDFMKTVLSDIDIAPPAPDELSWYYTTYEKDYAPLKPVEDKIIKAGAVAPDFTLPLFGGKGEKVSLSAERGKVVLLAFWIFHCGACQASVPKMNAMQEKYKGKNLKIFAINATDSDDLIERFTTNFKSAYPVLSGGEKAGKDYGVTGYPIVFLIGKDGKVIYSGLFNTKESEIEKLIEANL